MRKTIPASLCLLPLIAVLFDAFVVHARPTRPGPTLGWTVQVRHITLAEASLDDSRVLGRLMVGDSDIVGFSCIRAATDRDVDCYVATR